MIDSKTCWNCGHQMLWNEREKRYECVICGNSKETKIPKGRPNYIH